MSEANTKERKERKDFFWHLSVYTVVNTALIIVNLVSSPDTIWFIWPLMGWGIGLIFHALSVFVFKDWADTDGDKSTP